ncbi:MAG: DUF3243 domain-containing protein, partial [Desulfobacterales bacterium]|nr:DUF3243 domain-containing protein [Desulfobacterales bacterium]
MTRRPSKKRFLGALLFLGLWLILIPGVHAQHQGKTLTDAVEAAKEAGIPHDTINRLLTLGYERGVAPAST